MKLLKTLSLALVLTAVLLTAPPARPAAAAGWITAYYPTWSQWDLPPEKVDWSTMSHAIWFTVDPNPTTAPYYDNGYIDIQTRFINEAHAHGVKAILCIGGIWGPGADKMSALVANDAIFPTYIDNIVNYAKTMGYDGIDVDWEGPNSIAAGTKLLVALRNKLNTVYGAGNGLLTVASTVGGGAYDATVINNNVDQLNIMTYDMGNSTNAGFNTPLAPGNCTPWTAWTLADHSPDGWVNKGVLKSKVALGIPFYSWQFDGIDGPCQARGASKYGTYKQAMAALAANPSAYHWDSAAQVPWLGWTDTSGKHMITYDNAESVAIKANWAKNKGYGGVMIYELYSGIQTQTYPNPPLQPLSKALVDAYWGGIAPPPPPVDTAVPSIAISAPANGSTVSAATVTFNGTASDNVALSKVEISVDSGTYSAASGTANWTSSLSLANGSHTLTARATDTAGLSKIASVSITVNATTPPPGGTNLALNKTVTVSSTEATTYAAAYAVDGSTTTRWGSAYAIPQWIVVDLGASYNLSSVVLKWEGAFATAYTIGVSTNNTVWATAFSTTAGVGGTETRTLSSATGRYLRVSATAKNSPWGVSLWELEAYGTATPVDTTAPVVALVNPLANATVTSCSISVDGTASDDVAVSKVEVRVGTGAFALATGTANWTTTVTLATGANTIEAKATDGAGLMASVTRNVTCQPPVANNDLIVFADVLNTPWIDVSGGVTTVFGSNERAKVGSTSIKVTASSPLGALGLHNGPVNSQLDIDPVDFAGVSFSVYPLVDGLKLGVRLGNDMGDSFHGRRVSILPKNTWTTVNLSMADLNAANFLTHRLQIQDVTRQTGNVFYLDDVKFYATSSTTVTPSTLCEDTCAEPEQIVPEEIPVTDPVEPRVLQGGCAMATPSEISMLWPLALLAAGLALRRRGRNS